MLRKKIIYVYVQGLGTTQAIDGGKQVSFQ